MGVFSIAIEIGFYSCLNTVQEPDNGEITPFSDVMITKSIPSEQTFVFDLRMSVQCGNLFTPYATSRSENETLKDFDLLTATRDVMFLPQQQTIPIDMVIYGDNRLEGTECFGIAIFSNNLIPSFFPGSEIQISIKDNGK